MTLTRSFVSLFGLTEDQSTRKTAIAATRNDIGVVVVGAGGKAPVCILSVMELRAQGRDHPCGVAHVITDPVQANKVFSRFTLGGRACNIGVVAGPSRLIIVDCDTAQEVAAFLAAWANATGDPAYLLHTPTVMTPGQVDDHGVWVHKDGGHFYFTLPDGVTLSWDHRSALVAPGGYLVKWGMSQVVAPPSVRPEGRYVATGDIMEAPAFLVQMVQAEIESVATRREQAGEIFRNDEIAAWSVLTTWRDLLEPRGWTSTGKHEHSCGCEVWTKPGGGTTSPRSAIAHEPGCREYPLLEGHGPLYLFTTDPGPELEPFITAGQHAITKLQFVAAYDHHGDIEDAKVALDLERNLTDWITESPSPDISQGSEGIGEGQTASPETDDVTGEADPGGGTPGADPDPFFTPDEIQAGVTDKIKRLAVQEQLRRRAMELLDFRIGGPSLRMSIVNAATIVPTVTVPDVAHRNDGVALLYRGRVNTIWGPSDSGKSWFSLACAIDVVRHGGRVLIIDTEDDETGLWVRLDLLGAVSDRISYLRMWSRPDSRESVELLAAAVAADLIIIDSLDGYLALFRDADSNSATQVRAAGALMKRWAQAGSAAVLVVDHSTEKTQHGEKSATALGSSAKKQLIDGVMLRADRETIWKPGKVCRTWIMLGKDRHGHTKAWAEFETDDSPWGRVAELVLTPGLDGSTLSILKPRSYAEAPDGLKISDDERAAIESDVLALLNKTPGQWVTRTAVLKAAGDKNNRSAVPGRVVDQMVTDGLLEVRSEEMTGVNAGRMATYYRVSVSPSQSGSPSPNSLGEAGSGDPGPVNDKDNDQDSEE